MTTLTQAPTTTAQCPTWCVDHWDWGSDETSHRSQPIELAADEETVTLKLVRYDDHGQPAERYVTLNDGDPYESVSLTPAQAVELGQRLIALAEQART